MRSGKLRHRVTIERATDTRSPTGAVGTTYAPWLTRIAAQVLPAGEAASGRESFVSAQIQAVVDTRIRIRYRDGITAKMRVRRERGPGSPTDVELWDIEAVLEADSRKSELWLMCKRRDADGYRSGEA